jgi:hypothetical protein
LWWCGVWAATQIDSPFFRLTGTATAAEKLVKRVAVAKQQASAGFDVYVGCCCATLLPVC